MNEEDARLDQLLARGSLGGPHHDEILQRVLERTQAAEPRPKWLLRWLVPAAGLAAALGMALLLVRSGAQSQFAPKGPSGGNSHALQVGCGPAGLCRAGGTLMFSVNAALVSGYLGAYAERTDDPSHQRIWYFPDAAGAAPFVAVGTGTLVLPRGIEIGPEHRPGRYRVTVWIASRPLSPAQVDHAGSDLVRGRSTFDVDISP